MNWAHGYTNDINYISSYYAVTAPTHLRLVQLINGAQPTLPQDNFRCLEIGTGTGIGLANLAAAHPEAQFVGIDFMPGHIAIGQHFVREAGLTNIGLEELDLLDLAETGDAKLGKFDYVICHGVYTWVAPNVRKAIVGLLDQCTAPGGLVYFGYNSLPGWSPVAPIQKLVRAHADQYPARSDDATRAGFDLARRMEGASAQFVNLSAIPLLGGKETLSDDHASTEVIRYLAHEYSSDHWAPAYHVDVAKDLAGAKLSFVGATRITDTISDMVLTKEQQAVVAEHSSPDFRETLRDYFSPQMYRRDVYCRGSSPLSNSERSRLLDEVTLALIVDLEDTRYSIKCRAGDAEIPEHSYRPVYERLAQSPTKISELRAIAAANGHPLGAEELAILLVGSDQAMPMPRPNAKATDALLRFNKAIAEFAILDLSAHNLGLIGSRTQNAHHLGRGDMIFFLAWLACGRLDCSDPAFAEAASALCERYGEKIVDEGEAVTDPARHRQLISEYLKTGFAKRLRYLELVGAV